LLFLGGASPITRKNCPAIFGKAHIKFRNVMKKRYLTGLFLLLSIAGCTSTQPLASSKPIVSATLSPQAKPPKQDPNQANIDDVLNRIKNCVNSLNNGSSAKLVDGQILALDQSNPNAKSLFASNEKLTDEQVSALVAFKKDSQTCRQIGNQLTNVKLRKTYQNLFARLDRVYEDLIYKKITIGVANQERVLLVDDFRMQWRDEIKQQQGK
jgi:surface antigen